MNECVEEIAAHGENRAKSILSLRSGGGRKLTPEERKNALELMHTVGVCHGHILTGVLSLRLICFIYA